MRLSTKHPPLLKQEFRDLRFRIPGSGTRDDDSYLRCGVCFQAWLAFGD